MWTRSPFHIKIWSTQSCLHLLSKQMHPIEFMKLVVKFPISVLALCNSERSWHMRIPGFGGDELRPFRRQVCCGPKLLYFHDWLPMQPKINICFLPRRDCLCAHASAKLSPGTPILCRSFICRIRYGYHCWLRCHGPWKPATSCAGSSNSFHCYLPSYCQAVVIDHDFGGESTAMHWPDRLFGAIENAVNFMCQEPDF